MLDDSQLEGRGISSSGRGEEAGGQERERPGRWRRLWLWLRDGQDDYPPRLTRWDNVRRVVFLSVSLVAAVYLLLRFCWGLQAGVALFCDYVALAVLPLGVLIDRYVRRDRLIHDGRLEDHSEVQALIVEARTVEQRLTGTHERPENYDKKRQDVLEEVDRLEQLDEDGWTEYELLALNQMLVDFLKLDDLKERARSSLDDLEEYAIESAISYDLRKYDRWKERIENAIERIKVDATSQDEAADKEVDSRAEPLRAALRTLQEHVSNYRAFWAEGSAIIRSLIIGCAVVIPTLLSMGLLPLAHPEADGILRFFNWGFLGVGGALTGVLLSLRQSDVAEVGVTEGKRELWRTVIGAVLGLVAGILAFAMVAGGLFKEGLVVPSPNSSEQGDVALAVLWAIGAGFSFERIFDRLRGATAGSGAAT